MDENEQEQQPSRTDRFLNVVRQVLLEIVRQATPIFLGFMACENFYQHHFGLGCVALCIAASHQTLVSRRHQNELQSLRAEHLAEMQEFRGHVQEMVLGGVQAVFGGMRKAGMGSVEVSGVSLEEMPSGSKFEN